VKTAPAFFLLFLTIQTPTGWTGAVIDEWDQPVDSSIQKDSSDTTAVINVEEPVLVDTVLYRPGELLSGYTAVTDQRNFETTLIQNPTLALFKSMVVPGWGQFGNRRYIKAVVYLGLDVWFIGAALHYREGATGYRDRYETAEDIALRNELYSLYLDRRDERNKFTWFAVIITFVSMFDAYADAHLSGFPSKEHSLGWQFDIDRKPDGKLSACLCFNF
jgi:hypothetical protein